jgi:hypothetical protein
MVLEEQIGALYQRQSPDVSPVYERDLREDIENKPFGVNYFKTPKELPLEWASNSETGTRGGGIVQKDD